ncbi:PAS domain-containing protein [Sphingomonas sanguinis]|uniref:sensor histidine kinase n=1 Tax=Sphingomonas sp. LC-1 TaxID=3110957 RepID=UPI0021BABA9D|nr:PAS domain-containing protein [Sphingomonas sp. LC-1]MCT8000882.1 PAS domain-containing protein [Sphingomonas sp. LC-1]
MLDPSVLTYERRAAMIRSYDLAGYRESGHLDDLAAFAAELCATPVALVSLVEEETQRFLAVVGLEADQSPRDTSFCAHAMIGREATMVVPDARADPRFADFSLVTGPPYIRFYAGARLLSHEGVPLGAICVISPEPRPQGLTPFQQRGLEILATAVMGRLQDRRAQREHEQTVEASEARVADSEQRFRTLADTMPQMVWSTLPDGFHDYYNARWYEFTGMPDGSTDGEAWNGMFHEDDQQRAWTLWRHSLATGDPYQIEYRLRHRDGTYRWVLGRALPIRDANGQITRWFGTCTDIHEQKLALEEREIVSQELSHRIKNIFAVISGLIAFAARSHPGFGAIASDLRDRITALGRAHDFVRPHSPQSQPKARQDSLHGLLGDLFEPYRGDTEARIRLDGDDVPVDDRSATPLALLFHELATNASKYGALSVMTGHVVLTVTRRDDMVTLCWQEHDGPALDAAPTRIGFGSQLVELSAVRQLGGTVGRDWRAEGLVVTIEVPLAAFSRPAGLGPGR